MDKEDRHSVAADVPEQNRQSMSRILVIGATGLIGPVLRPGLWRTGTGSQASSATSLQQPVACWLWNGAARTSRPCGWRTGQAILLLYAVAGTVLTPWLWLDPLAPLLKIAPVIALLLVALATLEDR